MYGRPHVRSSISRGLSVVSNCRGMIELSPARTAVMHSTFCSSLRRRLRTARAYTSLFSQLGCKDTQLGGGVQQCFRFPNVGSLSLPDGEAATSLTKLYLLAGHGDVCEGAAGPARGVGALTRMVLGGDLSTKGLQLCLVTHLLLFRSYFNLSNSDV